MKEKAKAKPGKLLDNSVERLEEIIDRAEPEKRVGILREALVEFYDVLLKMSSVDRNNMAMKTISTLLGYFQQKGYSTPKELEECRVTYRQLLKDYLARCQIPQQMMIGGANA